MIAIEFPGGNRIFVKFQRRWKRVLSIELYYSVLFQFLSGPSYAADRFGIKIG